ncbi:hypothetical protein Trydic_g19688 [Trypoxylus dichotomus]
MFQNEELEVLLDIDPFQKLEELSAALDLDRSTVEKRLHALGMVQEAGNWVPHEVEDESKCAIPPKTSDIDSRQADRLDLPASFIVGQGLLWTRKYDLEDHVDR